MIVGYLSHLGAAPGDDVQAFVRSSSPFSAHLVRLCGVDTRGGTPQRATRVPVQSTLEGTYPAQAQVTRTGSYADLPLTTSAAVPLQVFRFSVWMLATSPHLPRQVVASVQGTDAGWQILLDEGRLSLELRAGGTTWRLDGPALPERPRWVHLRAGLGAQHVAFLELTPAADVWRRPQPARRYELSDCTWQPGSRFRRLLLAAAHEGGAPVGRFNGRLAAPRIENGDGLLAEWDLGVRPESSEVVDTSGGGCTGRLHNGPTRAVLGPTWSGRSTDWRQDPSEWNAVHFHDDDLSDAAWTPSITWRVPQDLPSGIYGIVLDDGDSEDCIPLFVRAPTPTADVLFLAPTNTYLAYANERLGHGERGAAHEKMMRGPVALAETDRVVHASSAFGLSAYDTHSDGSGVMYSGRLRPVLNMRPDYETWLNAGRRHLAADLLITGWLEHRSVPFDVATDEDLDRDGVQLLQQYRVVVTGSHPEYVTTRGHDAVVSYLADGGHVMYLGANGFYWVTTFTDASRSCIEVRRGYAAQRNWTSHPAEIHHSSTGERGGAWWERERSSFHFLGVGTSAVGWADASPYRRTVRSYDPDLADIFEGIESDTLGDRGIVLDGAAGDELDATNVARGTPPEAVVLMRSSHGAKYYPTLENSMALEPGLDGTANSVVRSEVVLLPTPRGGAVFAASSICWAGALAADGYTNDISTLTANVLRRFRSQS